MDATSSETVIAILPWIIAIWLLFLAIWTFLDSPERRTQRLSSRFQQCVDKKDYFHFRKLLEDHPTWNCDFLGPAILDPWNHIIEMPDAEAANQFFVIGLSISPAKTIDQSILTFAEEHDFQFSPEVMKICNEYVGQKQNSD